MKHGITVFRHPPICRHFFVIKAWHACYINIYSAHTLSTISSVTDCPHQYIDRQSGDVVTERFISESVVSWLYCRARELHPHLFRLATQRFGTKLLAYLNYDAPLFARAQSFRSFISDLGIVEAECVRPLATLPKLREVFERQIRYWDVRPMPTSNGVVVSPCDSRVLLGRTTADKSIPIKEKFFSLNELVGADKVGWQTCFRDGDFAIFRLTPEKYHYNHLPVSGRVADIYEIDGEFHSCNPSAVVRMVTPYSKNRRCVTIIDTDVEGGTNVGFVAMIEVVALMIGEIVQCYCEEGYGPARSLQIGQFVKRGAVKSLFRPGSSTVLLLFEQGRLMFDYDLVKNSQRHDVQSRFSYFFGERMIETDVAVRSSIGSATTTRARPGLFSNQLSESEIP